MKTLLCLSACLLLGSTVVEAADESKPRFYDLKARASEIDSRVQAHPEINFVLEENGKPLDVERGAFDSRVPSQGRLVIWLMGHSPELAELVTGYGLHYIQVHYANGWFAQLSPKAGDDDQFLGNIRLEASIGKDVSPAVDIPHPDSIEERARQLVQHFARTNPEGNWQQFLTPDGSELLWEKVTLAGASHGATTAARFAKHRRVGRVVMLCGPRDQLETWQALPSSTPGNRYFGFSHILDTGWSGDHYCRSWELLGLQEYGPIVDVDQVPPPYQNTRRLITAADVQGNASRAHSSVVPGRSAVKDAGGKFIHEPVWRYMFLHPVDEVGEKSPEDPGCRKDLKQK
ncbi:BPSS1187 family protein [Planctomicrobium sp. SH661]|uniref:BPSS1187 family protein n=1 Tax=Planctomicrobium sp. SH661 TaxID=3448124 RepID=UPI003F5B3036